MRKIRVEYTRVIEASPTIVYGIIADYRVGHPAILPKPYFTYLKVLNGGYGDGTEIEFEMNVFGTKQVSHSRISEPEPGRKLVETQINGSVVTTFLVEPVANSKHAQVTFITELDAKAGIGGWIEGFMTPFILRYIYKQEMEQLNAYAKTV